MNHRHCFETLDRTLRDILDEPDTLFGGKSVMLGGDFRQTLPVKKNASKNETIASSIAESYLWKHFKVISLHENMRLQSQGLQEHERQNIHNFSEWLLAVGDGNLGTRDESDKENSSWVHIPDNFCISDCQNATMELINFIYDSETLQRPTAKALQDRAIVCPKNETADVINSQVLNILKGELKTYSSSDEAIPKDNVGGETELLYPVEYLNTLSFSGFPQHKLSLKVGTPIMLLRNMNLIGGLCNGTRLIVTQLLTKVIEAQIITGTRISEKVFLPRILLINKDDTIPFVFKRKQFPVKICYAMTINKSQGQSLNKIGIYLPDTVFGHGQLYVALSRATSPEGLKILIKQQENQPANTTKNIVYKDFLEKIRHTQVYCIYSIGHRSFCINTLPFISIHILP